MQISPDGTELTVMQNDTEAYAYLENSFVTLHISQIDGMSDAEIDAILDIAWDRGRFLVPFY